MKLHLGCFNKKIHGFINVDIREDVSPDAVDDVFTLYTFPDNYAELIYACHVLEHASREDAKMALKNWYRVLKPNGILRIAVPDMAKHFAHYFYYGNLDILNSALWGSQRHEYDFHYHGWDEKTIKRDLEAAGFIYKGRYDWRKTEHHYIDDYSQAYQPHMDKENGMLMSLNVEAIKP